MKVGSPKWLLLAMLCACEVIADFDRDKLDDTRTIGPTPFPPLDAMALMPDATTDGALIGPDDDDAGDAAGDAASSSDAAGLDASQPVEVIPDEPDATTGN